VSYAKKLVALFRRQMIVLEWVQDFPWCMHHFMIWLEMQIIDDHRFSHFIQTYKRFINDRSALYTDVCLIFDLITLKNY
jgi:hypothetical protein